jgi:hypothetical protein
MLLFEEEQLLAAGEGEFSAFFQFKTRCWYAVLLHWPTGLYVLNYLVGTFYCRQWMKDVSEITLHYTFSKVETNKKKLYSNFVPLILIPWSSNFARIEEM